MVGKDVTVCQEEYPGPTFWGITVLPVLQVPSAMKEFPGKLKGNEGFPSSCSQCEKDAILTVYNGLQGLVDGIVLVVTGFPCSPLVLERDL